MNRTVKTSFVAYFLFTCYLTSLAQESRPAHIGLIYPISTNGMAAPEISNNFSVHAITGVSGGEEGVALYGVGGIIKGDGKGFMASGVWTDVQGAVEGVQMAGVFNRAGNAVRGAQFAGVFNLSHDAAAVQMAGVINKADKAHAMQAGGVVNLANSIDGVQIGGVANVAEAVKGSQIGGLINIADEVDGFQMAGLVNKSRVVKGVQLSGLINIADSSDYPLGLINLVKNGEQRIGLSTDEVFNSMVSFRSGGQKLYGILGLGANLDYETRLYSAEAGLGLKLVDAQPFRLDFEGFSIFSTDFHGLEYNKSGLRLLPELGLGNRIYLYAGPSINYTVHNLDNGDLFKMPIWEKSPRHLHKSIHLGYTFGVQVKL
ncbi:MAG TPA: hypothetical protein VK014_10465 [Cyclobacteriaceae bacterium]|nr:hypothetical protein [Cyclobacteriaceae bacterium]